MTVHSAPCVFPRQWGHHDFAVSTRSESRLCNMSAAHACVCTWVMASLLTMESPSSSVSILKQKEKLSSTKQLIGDSTLIYLPWFKRVLELLVPEPPLKCWSVLELPATELTFHGILFHNVPVSDLTMPERTVPDVPVPVLYVPDVPVPYPCSRCPCS